MGYTAKGPKDMKPGTPPKGPAGASSANPRQGKEQHEPEDT
jgi:hypothetical protein